ncbi:hypothetical protein JTB14_025887 [Gonioctena quinquepunctata]|nr:hypothetical protein JTB14_025887 [Gonioctena quinquepunctata]
MKCNKKRKSWFPHFSLSSLFCCISKNPDSQSKFIHQCDPDPEALDLVLYKDLQEVTSSENLAYSSPDKNCEEPETEDIASTDILKFNVTINENTCIECMKRKDGNSLTIFYDSNCKYEEGSSDIALSRDSKLTRKRKKVADSSKEEKGKEGETLNVTLEKVDQLQKKYCTLSSKFGSFNTTIIKSISTIRNEVDHLRRLINRIGCVVVEAKKSALPTKNKLQLAENVSQDRALLKTQEFKYVQAKIRASNFCRFYNLRKTISKKRRSKNNPRKS